MPIPMTEILAYATMFDYSTPDERDILMSAVQIMDAEFLIKRSSKESGKGSKKKGAK